MKILFTNWKVVILLSSFFFISLLEAEAGRRPDINSFTPLQQQDLRNLILQFACNPQPVFNGISANDFHANSFCDAHTNSAVCNPGNCNGTPVNEDFLPWHRDFIEALEGFLSSNGGAQFVPLPAWNPCNTIPAAFMGAASTCSGVTGPATNNPNCGDFGNNNDPYSCENLCDFSEFCEFSIELELDHNAVHGAVGGSMTNPNFSASTAIFYVWHAYVDDVWFEWQTANMTNDLPLTIQTTTSNCSGSATFAVDRVDCLNNVSWSIPGANSVSISNTSTQFRAIATFTHSNTYTAAATLNSACSGNSKTITTTRTICTNNILFELYDEGCGYTVHRIPKACINGGWIGPPPGVTVNATPIGNYYHITTTSNTPGNHTIFIGLNTPCGWINIYEPVYVCGATPNLPSSPPPGMDEICNGFTECYDFKDFSCIDEILVSTSTPKLHATVNNGTELCLEGIWFRPFNATVTVTPIGPCGTGNPVTWSVYVDDCEFMPLAEEGTEYELIGEEKELTTGTSGFSVENSISLPMEAQEDTYKVFPNPFRDQVQLKFNPGEIDAILTTEIINAQGMLLKRITGNEMTINTTAYPPGTYIVRVKDVTGKLVHTEKLIKQ